MWKGLLIFFSIVIVLLLIVFLISHFSKPKVQQAAIATTDSDPAPPDSSDTKPKCKFEGEDVFNKHIFYKNGKLIEDEKTITDCETCSDYVYKSDGSCYTLMFDTTYNDDSDISDKDDPKNIKARRTCTAKMKPSTCPF